MKWVVIFPKQVSRGTNGVIDPSKGVHLITAPTREGALQWGRSQDPAAIAVAATKYDLERFGEK